jgi:membrane-associated protease RseP (regulator of RpoE activity)
MICGYACYIPAFLASWLIAYLALRGRSASLEARGVTLGPLFLAINFRSLGARLERSLSRSRAASRIVAASPAVAAALMVYAVYFLASNMASYFAAPSGFAAVVPLIPFVTIRSAQLLAIFLAAIPILIVPHELSHALAAASRGIRIKGAGFLAVAFLLGAFVELDEDSFRRAGWRHRATVAAAGPTANAAIAVAVLALMLTQPLSYLYLPAQVAAPFYSPAPGAMIAGVVPGSPAQAAGLAPGDAIVSINGTQVRSVGDLAGMNLSAGELLVLGVVGPGGAERTVSLRAADVSGRAMVGVYLADYMRPRLQLPYLGPAADRFLLWLLVLSFAVAAFNMLPMAPFDGAVFADALLEAAIGDEAIRRVALRSLYVVSAALLVGNVTLSIARFGIPAL